MIKSIAYATACLSVWAAYPGVWITEVVDRFRGADRDLDGLDMVIIGFTILLMVPSLVLAYATDCLDPTVFFSGKINKRWMDK